MKKDKMGKSTYKIGIVLSGGMSKGAYKIGCLQAIVEYFGLSSVSCISASSIGVPIGYSFLTQKSDDLVAFWKKIDIEGSGRFFPNLSGNPNILAKMREMICEEDRLDNPFYISLWNFSDQKAEYLNLQETDCKKRKDYITASVSIPLFGKGMRLDHKVYFDGAFLDNIPVYPLQNCTFDFLFCIYFDRQCYLFEDASFDSKIIKLNAFPIQRRWLDNFVFDPQKTDAMIEYGYSYCKNKIEHLFCQKNKEEIYRQILLERELSAVKNRRTADTVLTNVNRMMAKFAKKKIL